MKKFLFLAVVLLGVGVSVWYYVLRPQGPQAEVEEPRRAADARSAYFVSIPSIAVSVLQRDKGFGQLLVTITLEVADQRVEGEIRARQTELTDVFLRTLYDLAEEEVRQEAHASLDQIKARFKRATERIVGRGKIVDVLIQNIVRKNV